MQFIIIFLVLISCDNFSKANWCSERTTYNVNVTKYENRVITYKSFFSRKMKHKVAKVLVTELIPQTKIKLVCCEGYILKGNKCITGCKNGCPKLAKCVKPNLCDCPKEYQLIEGECRLNCQNCVNGNCNDLGICECKSNYERIGNTCKPTCHHTCVDGHCVAPDICECNIGFQKNMQTNICEPICKVACGANAKCNAPENCICNPGFSGNPLEGCKPWCENGCKNGQCLDSNICICDNGFEKVGAHCVKQQAHLSFLAKSQKTGLLAVKDIQSYILECGSDCKNGACINGKCQCNDGFTLADLDCRIECENCTIGECIEEGLCRGFPTTETTPSSSLISIETTTLQCKEGFVKVKPSCQANCKNCNLGDCVAEKLCQDSSTVDLKYSTSSERLPHQTFSVTDLLTKCFNGTILDESSSKCLSACDKTCKNGECYQQNVCVCRSDYVPNGCECLENNNIRHNISNCLPSCNSDKDCTSGKCFIQTRCLCGNGYMLQNEFKCMPLEALEKHFFIEPKNILRTILLVLLLLVIISIGIISIFKILHKRTYKVDEVEKYRELIIFPNNDESQCTL